MFLCVLFFLMIRRPPRSTLTDTLFPYTTLFRSGQLAAIIAPVFVCAAIGYLWARLRRPFETEFVTALVTNVGTPCLVASTLTKLSVDVGSFGSMALGALAVFATVGVIGAIGLRLAGLPYHSYLPAIMRSEERRVGKECSSKCRHRWS